MLHLEKKKKRVKKKNTTMWGLIIWMTLLIKRDYIKKPLLNIYIYIYESFDNRLLVGVEIKFLKLR